MEDMLLGVLISLLKLCDSFMETISIFIGAKHIEVNEEHLVLIDMLLHNETIKNVFWGAFFTGIFFIVLFMFITFPKNKLVEERTPIKHFFIKISKSLALYAIVPIFIFLFIHGVSLFVLKVEHIIHESTHDTEVTIGNSIFMMLSFGSEKEEFLDDSFGFKDVARKNFFADNNLYYDVANVNTYFEFSMPVIIIGIIISVILLIVMAVALFTFVKGMFDLVLLFVCSPYLLAMMPLDNGKRLKKWLITFAAKLCSDFGVVITFKLFINIILAIILSGEYVFSSVILLNVGLMILLIVGGCIAVVNSHEFMIELLEEQFEKIKFLKTYSLDK